MWQTIVTSAVTAVLTSLGAYFVARARLRQEFLVQFQAEIVIQKLLSTEAWELRSFEKIKHHIGGFNDDELRQLLVRAGAVRFEGQEKEMWGLYERTQNKLEKPKSAFKSRQTSSSQL